MKSKTISVVVPIFNESDNIAKLVQSLDDVFINLKSYTYEILLVNDGSSDNSLAEIKNIHRTNKRVSFLSFSRNFGKEAATSAGIINAKGNAVICVDADGQHPVNIIPEFISRWENGDDIVIGVRISNNSEGLIKKYGSKLFYVMLKHIDENGTIPGSTDFRLIDSKVADEFRKLTERNRITRGLIDWLGFKKSFVEFKALPRESGKASYSFKKLFKLAMHSFVSQSTKPLKLTGLLGVITTLLSSVIGVFFVIEMYLFNDPLNLNISGTALLGVGATFLIGVVLVCQGLLALYIESIHTETQNRPLYIIAEKSA